MNKYSLLLIIILISSSCDFEPPEKWETPQWHLPLTIPLIDEIYFITDISDTSNQIEINDKITIFLKYPNIETANKIKNTEDIDGIMTFLSSGIEFIKDEETLHETKDFTQEEVIEFFEQFNQQQMLKIQNFYRTQPVIQHDINYTCEKCGGEESIILRGLQDFLE